MPIPRQFSAQSKLTCINDKGEVVGEIEQHHPNAPEVTIAFGEILEEYPDTVRLILDTAIGPPVIGLPPMQEQEKHPGWKEGCQCIWCST